MFELDVKNKNQLRKEQLSRKKDDFFHFNLKFFFAGINFQIYMLEIKID